MIIGYIRVSTDAQTTENQRFEILKFADSHKWQIDEWCEETVSGKKKAAERLLGGVIARLGKGDTLVVSELSRLGRSLLEVMSILNSLIEKQVKVFSIKENYELGDDLTSKVIAFSHSLSAEIERNLISQRTKEALARRKAEGKHLGRPVGALGKANKLSGKEKEIGELVSKKVSMSAIARIYNVNRLTVKRFLRRF